MPTTVMPMTAPLENATRRAGLSPRMAVAAVRPLARTATLMPTKPAAAEQRVPTKVGYGSAGDDFIVGVPVHQHPYGGKNQHHKGYEHKILAPQKGVGAFADGFADASNVGVALIDHHDPEGHC